MTLTLLALAVLILLSGFFSGAEIALFSVSEARARSLEREGGRAGRLLMVVKSNPERLLTTILVGNNVVNIAAASLATVLALETFGAPGVAYATGVMTLLVLIFGEITPKSFAAANAVRVSLAVAPIVWVMSRILFPIILPLEGLTRWFVRRSEASGVPTVTEGEIREMTAIGHSEGQIDEHERELIERAFRLDTTRAWDVMTPRVEIFAWDGEQTLADVSEELITVPFSRIPVFRETIDDVVGVVHTRDAYQALVGGRADARLDTLVRGAFFVPGGVPLTSLLRDFQARRIHMGVVIDEYGGTDGLVTLEDILEELVGEIVDETDLERQPIVRISRNEIVVEGGADLREINHFLKTTFPHFENRSLNGYLLEELGHVPEAGEELTRDGVRIQVEEATETQVLRARLVRPPPAEASTASEGRPDTAADHS